MAKRNIIFQAGVNAATTNRLAAILVDGINKGLEEMTIFISSGGGSVFHGMGIATLIKASPVPVVIHNVGKIDSIAGVIFAAAQKRFANKNSSFLFHGVTTQFLAGASLTEPQMVERLATVKRDRENIAKNISDYSGVDHTKIADLMEKGSIITSDDAKAMGLVHEIVEAKLVAGVETITVDDIPTPAPGRNQAPQ